MHRLRWTPFAATLVLATASGCAVLVPDPATVAAPEAAAVPAPSAAAPSAAVAPTPTPTPAPEPTAAALPSPGPDTTTRRVETPPAQPPTRVAATPGPARNAAPSSGVPPAAPASGAERPGTGSGPTVTTFVFSDAPAPVRRGVARGETAPGPAAGRVPEGFNPYRIAFEPGTYRCELGRRVEVRSVAADLRSTVLRWGEGDYTLRSVDARSGALRYEDAGSGLAWIVLRDRSMLLDTRAGQRLANACRARSGG